MNHQQQIHALRQSLAQTIVGQENLLDALVIGLLTGGHILVEGLPGLAKTTAINTLAQTVHAGFQRIQFTPDLLPGDLTGAEIYHPDSHRFEFRPGPLFHEIILADEINRAPAKVQAALLEAMQEHQVTVGGETRPLPDLFLVMATQNPVEQSGTYPLPEAQMDRFLMQVVLHYPDEAEELEILRRSRRSDKPEPPATLDVASVLAAREEVRRVHLAPELEEYIVRLTVATREASRWLGEQGDLIEVGASPRATLAMAQAAAAEAYLRGRDYVIPDDVLAIAPGCLQHRILPSMKAQMQQVDAGEIIRRLVDVVPVP